MAEEKGVLKSSDVPGLALTQEEILKLKKMLSDKKGFMPTECVACIKYVSSGAAVISKFPSKSIVETMERDGIIKVIWVE